MPATAKSAVEYGDETPQKLDYSGYANGIMVRTRPFAWSLVHRSLAQIACDVLVLSTE